MEPTTNEVENEGRKRKSHTKSRKGCGNCKLRRVKCDEARPQCKKCINYGVNCNYGAESDELQLPGEGAFTFLAKPQSSGPGNGPTIPKDSMSPEDDKIDTLLGLPLQLHDTSESYLLVKEDLDTLRMFRNGTVYTIGTAHTVHIYRDNIVSLASRASYLMHIVLTLTLMHNRFISSSDIWNSEPFEKESFHWYHGTALFNRMLSQPVKEEDKDPLWGASAILGAITIAYTEAKTAQDAWPLKTLSSNDLDWLRMSDGKKEIWRLTNPLRPGSLWRDVMNYETQKDPEPYSDVIPELDMLYPFLTKLYDFDPLSSSKEDAQDPYHTAASILVRLLELECNHSTIMYFLSFLGHMDPRFRDLVHEKDPKALLLLVWWYGKMCTYNVWWQKKRMTLEGQAICIYLEQNHSDQEGIMRLLDYPKMMTGLVRG